MTLHQLRRSIMVLLGFLQLCTLPGLHAAERSDADEIVFLLQYIGTDYGLAVRDGRIVDAFEYQEMVDFVQRAAAGYRAARPSEPADSPLNTAFADLAAGVEERRSPEAILEASGALASRVATELAVVTAPARPPDLVRGRALYAADCAICHGPAGGGDGTAARHLVPPPSSFRERRMNRFSPHQVLGATLAGIPGTGMPSYRGVRSIDELWDVAFWVLTLRADFRPEAPPVPLRVTLDELARRSTDDLLARLHAAGETVSPAQVDHLRAHPTAASPAGDDTGVPPALLALEQAFEQIAEAGFPSVVGVTAYVRDSTPLPAEPQGGWQVTGDDARRYPGYRPVRSGSGFVVTEDGFALSCRHIVADAEIVDVELAGNLHYRARIVGLEPSVNLAVLKVEAPVKLKAAPLGESTGLRAGQWAVALGDPPGVERTFAVGTIAAAAQRECYQENRTATLLQASQVLDPGAFGGPLVNLRGSVIGLITPRDATRPAPGEPLYALPIDLVRTIYDVLRVQESKLSPWLGVSVTELDRNLRRHLPSAPLTGVYIDDVFEPSPASRAGVRVGDVLVALDGNRLFAVADFQRWLYLLGIGKEVTLQVDRAGQTLELRVPIEQRPATIPTR